jgi:hypothetical protein
MAQRGFTVGDTVQLPGRFQRGVVTHVGKGEFTGYYTVKMQDGTTREARFGSMIRVVYA